MYYFESYFKIASLPPMMILFIFNLFLVSVLTRPDYLS